MTNLRGWLHTRAQFYSKLLSIYILISPILPLISSKPENTELVITGRDAAPQVIEKADLVTEMKETKHYFQKGVQARVGIEK